MARRRFLEPPEWVSEVRLYTRELTRRVKQWEAKALPVIEQALNTYNDSWVDDMERTVDQLWQDQIADLVIFRSIASKPEMQFRPRPGDTVVEKAFKKASQRQVDHWSKTVAQVTGSDLKTAKRISQQDFKQVYQQRLQQNAELIKDIGTKTATDITTLTREAVRKGTRTDELMPILKEQFQVSDRRARVICRDQISKHQGAMVEGQQVNAGIGGYRWRSSEDKSVRPLHQAYNGNLFEWAKPPADGHPGNAVQCRCFAEPDIPDDIFGIGVKSEYRTS
jgi:SPP1 gp7 family putative phage head morphogenesis protein